MSTCDGHRGDEGIVEELGCLLILGALVVVALFLLLWSWGWFS